MFVKKLKDLGPSRLALTTITVRILSQGPESPEHAQEMKKRGKIAGDGFCSLQFCDKGLNVKGSSILDINAIEGSKMSEMTTEILEQNLTKIVLVKLKGGKSLRGRLKGFDQHLNLVLEETEDNSNPESVKKLGLIIVRGDNVVLISPPPR